MPHCARADEHRRSAARALTARRECARTLLFYRTLHTHTQHAPKHASITNERAAATGTGTPAAGFSRIACSATQRAQLAPALAGFLFVRVAAVYKTKPPSAIAERGAPRRNSTAPHRRCASISARAVDQWHQSPSQPAGFTMRTHRWHGCLCRSMEHTHAHAHADASGGQRRTCADVWPARERHVIVD